MKTIQEIQKELNTDILKNITVSRYIDRHREIQYCIDDLIIEDNEEHELVLNYIIMNGGKVINRKYYFAKIIFGIWGFLAKIGLYKKYS